jgi:hypothetical protein
MLIPRPQTTSISIISQGSSETEERENPFFRYFLFNYKMVNICLLVFAREEKGRGEEEARNT